MIEQIRCFWNKRKKLFPGYRFSYPKLNQSLKWCFDYIIITNQKFRLKKKKKKKKKKNMDELLDAFSETLDVKFQQKFPRMIVKISDVRDSFYALIKK